MDALKILQEKIENQHKELLVLQFDVEDNIKLYQKRWERLRKDIRELLDQLDKS